ncbi:hypothetical protein [Streptosporangium sp. NPDC049078]|uniref:hypothetical protein n=1 Tax=Streptosporangium sp. NPDC049078 TaxID=3155767 RepID=UPI003430B14E
MRILDYFRTKRTLWLRVAMLTDELEETREECADLADERDLLTQQLAQAERERDNAWRTLAAEKKRPAPAPMPTTDAGLRAELRQERERSAALEARLDMLQRANMRRDVPV